MSTMTAVKNFKTNPLCDARRHGPNMESYRRGCRCETALGAATAWANAEAARRGCTGKVHTGTDHAWSAGCRHADALLAHEEAKLRKRLQRRVAMAEYKRTGQCGATVHGSAAAYQRGCRCEDARDIYANSSEGRSVAAMQVKFGHDQLANPWRQGRMAVSRINLWMLVRGFVDKPTVAERLAAVAILDQRFSRTISDRQPYSNREVVLPRLTNFQIAERIGVGDKAVIQLRAKRADLRRDRALRRLADVRCKAKRAQGAAERKEAERRRHEQAARHKADRGRALCG